MNELLLFFIILGLIILSILTFLAGKALGKRIMYDIMQVVIQNERRDAIKKSRSVLTGQFSEQISPYFPNFPVEPSECSFLGRPIDFIAFRGLDEKEITEIVFIEVKTGNAQMNKVQKSIKDAVVNKRVKFIEYRIK